jgi:beta-lactamase class C
MQILFFLALSLIFSPLYSYEDALKKEILKYMEEERIPGVAVAIFDDGKETILTFGMRDEQTQKPVTPDTIFEIASITKVFTSTALALHVLNGDMALNDPISNYLPALKKDSGAINKVTLLSLATHSSSLPRIAPEHKGHLPNRHQIIDFIQNWQPDTPIGSHYLYSNLAFGLLGYALENVERRPFEVVLMEDILLPLKMNHSFIHVPPADMHLYSQGYGKRGFAAPRRADNHLPGGGALRSTAADMLLFLKANLNVYGPEKLRAAMQETQKPFFKVSDKLTLGLGWQRVHIDKMLVIDKNGGLPGYSSYIGMIPEKKLGVVILMNRAHAESTEEGRYLLKFLAHQQPSK